MLDAVAEAIGEDEDLQIYTSGATNIFKYPELSDSKSASELIAAFEEKQELANLVNEQFNSDENTILSCKYSMRDNTSLGIFHDIEFINTPNKYW